MFRHTKFIGTVAGALVALLVLVWLGRQATPWYARHQLKSRMAKIEPWGSSTAYSEAGWKNLIQTARACQEASPALTTAALEEYLQSASANPDDLPLAQGKLFLLLRLVFDLPDSTPTGPGVSLAGWDRGGTDVNPDGTFDQAWPMLWNQGRPRLVSGRKGAAGAEYSAAKEYSMLRYRFKYRELPNSP